MTEEPKRRGRPPKSHLQEDHHFRASSEQPSAPPATSALVEPAAEAEAGSSQSSTFPEDNANEPADLFEESVVENPTLPSVVIADSPQEEEFLQTTTEETLSAFPVGNTPHESPIEEKIHELVEETLNGWKTIPKEEAPHVSMLPPRNGTAIKVAENVDDLGTLVLWKKTRAFSNPTKRWTEVGIWIDFMTGVPINFKPKYWRERYS